MSAISCREETHCYNMQQIVLPFYSVSFQEGDHSGEISASDWGFLGQLKTPVSLGELLELRALA